MDSNFTVSARAAARLQQILKPGERLRISVLGGGCSGFQYSFAAESLKNADDRLFGAAGAEVVIDETSLGLLTGAELDFSDDLMGAAFTITNPNATSSCGCGNSFSA